MTDNGISGPLAAALAQRGYTTLTAVQNAVLGADAFGRDLFVSAQTGSGKTVAFGIAVAPDLLGADDVLPRTPTPLALVIAPTRELALQVAAELRWLYAATGAQIATCVGGMDYRTERRALERGAQIVVGTPGRLRDHIDRGGLDLSTLRVAVLDEADEMLDLGFREDLEFILGAAPETRRTLMFSATVPPAIEKLARDFQRDGLRISAMGEARQHGDIAYRALTIAARDRENAIFNLLRFYEARTAIVFCKTRANVNHLLARMGNRGFRVVALSGELSQQERMHALQALRDGRARVCIATDVAARGIDLPGLELVIHADLPTNSETLLHRSGRTGRAGAKGVSALIVPPADQKKARRLLQGANVVAEWGAAPSASEVSARDDARMLDHPALSATLEDMSAAQALLDRVGPLQLAAAFVQLWREGRPPPEELTETAPQADSGPRAQREFGTSVWFSLSVGHSGRAEARWLLPKICEAGRITRDAIGAIRVREDETFVQIATADAPRFADVVEIEPGLVMRRMKGEPDLDRKSTARGPGDRSSAAKPRKAAGSKWEKPVKARASAPGAEASHATSAPRRARVPDERPRRDPAPAPEGAGPAGWSPTDEGGEASPAEAKSPRPKPRWNAAQKAAKSRKSGAASAPGKERRGDAARPGDSTKGKSAGKAAGKPKGKTAGTGRPNRGDAPPRRPKGRG